MKETMAALSTLTFRAFEGIDPGFKPAKALAHKDFASMIARVEEEISLYLFVRATGQADGVAVDLWVAPTDAPDDRLERFGIGYKIHIGTSWENHGETLGMLRKRLEIFLPHVSGIVEAARTELKRPALESKRLEVYRIERELYRLVLQFAATDGGRYCHALFESAMLVAQGKRKWSELETTAKRVAKELLADPHAHELLLRMPPAKVNAEGLLATMLCGPAYVEALAPLSNTGKAP